MDAVSYANSAKQAQRIKKFINDPDSTSGIVTVPKVIASGETITIPTGRVAVLPNVQIDGVLNVENGGEVFIPSGSILSTVVEKVTSTDNAIVRFDGTTGAVQNSGVTITDNGNVGIGTGAPADKLSLYTASGNIFTRIQSGLSTLINGTYSDGTSVCGTLGSNPMIFLTNNTERMRIDSAGNVLVTGSGGLGYGTGSGGTVTQLTSKSTAVTLNKPSGQITMNSTALAAGAKVEFIFSSALIGDKDTISVAIAGGASEPRNYKVEQVNSVSGAAYIRLYNLSDGSLSEAVVIQYNIIKGANS